MPFRPFPSIVNLTLIAIAAALASSSPASATKQVSGNIYADAVWDTTGGRIYQVTGTVTVQAGAHLTIDPGVVVKFNSATSLNVYGSLIAEGGAHPDSTIYFTSIKDDNLPPPDGDDTNGDGNDTSPGAHDWRKILFHAAAGDSSSLKHCEIWYAGYGGSAAIDCAGADPTIEDCAINASYYGIRCADGAEPVLRRTDFSACTSVPIAITLDARPTMDAIAFASTSDNTYDAIGLLPTTLTTDVVIDQRATVIGGDPIPNITYLLLGDVTVAAGVTLTVDPGVVIKSITYGVDIIVDGTLISVGTAEEPIVYTSVKDDNYGDPNDTNNDGSITAPAQSDWGGIDFRDGSSGSFEHCVIKYGGLGSERCLVRTDNSGTNVSFLNCEFSDADHALTLRGISNPVINGCSFANCDYTPVFMSVTADPTFDANTFTANGYTALGLIGETVAIDGHLMPRTVAGFENITYLLESSLTMDVGTVLTVDPGVVVKSTRYTRIDINGGLVAEAPDVESSIIFTSWKDDNWGNPLDTNGDGSASTPAVSDWGYIRYNATAVDADSRLDHVWIGYGGWDGSGSYECGLWSMSASPTVSNCTFWTNNIGFRVEGNAAPILTDNHFFNNQSVPIIVSVLSEPVFTGNTFDQNGYHAVGILSETLSEDAVLEISTVGVPQFDQPFPYYLLPGELTVGTDVVMTVEPGVVVKSSYYGITVEGGLLAQALTGEAPIIFTSIKDDTHGGDSNVDGADSAPAHRDWTDIHFKPTSLDDECRLVGCEFWYGGNGNEGVVQVDGASSTIRDCSFEFNDIGIWIEGLSAPTVHDNLVRQCRQEPFALDLLATPDFAGNVFGVNGYQALGIIGGSLAQDATLPVREVAGYENITYVLDSNLTIQFGSTLTFEPGLVIKCWGWGSSTLGGQIIVDGALVAAGTEELPIVFTSWRDDTRGVPLDTNGDGAISAPTAGDWRSIYFRDVSVDAVCVLEHAEVRYGGYSGSQGAIRAEGSAPTIRNTVIEYSSSHGISLEGPAGARVHDCTLRANGLAPIAMSLLAEPITSGNYFLDNGYTALGVFGETLASDVLWVKRDVGQVANIPYVLFSNMTVGTGATLTLEPGLVIKMMNGVGFYVQRALIAEGTDDPEGLIVFTSTTDDFYGGDTNGDGTDTDGDYRRWGTVEIQDTAVSAQVRFANCVFRNSINSDSRGAVVVKGQISPSFDSCLFHNNRVGINYQEASGDSTVGKVLDCDFVGNTSYGIRNTAGAHVISARGSWWGHDTGPFDGSDDTGSGGFYNPDGLGDPVTDMVAYETWGDMGLLNILHGDVSLNGRIRAYDSSLVLRSLVGDVVLNPRQELIGDVTCEGGLSSLDASYILQFVSGMIPYFPCAVDSTATMPMFTDFEYWPGHEPMDLQLAIDPLPVEPGDQVEVPIYLSGTGTVWALDLDLEPIEADLSIVEFISSMDGGEAIVLTRLLDGRARLAMAGTRPLQLDGIEPIEVARITVSASADAEAPPPVAFRYHAARANEISLGLTGDTPEIPQTPGLPVLWALGQNSPNPFNPRTTIRFDVPADVGDAVGTVLQVYDAGGRQVRTLVRGTLPPGQHEVVWDGRTDTGAALASGVYFYRLDAGTFSARRKMILVR